MEKQIIKILNTVNGENLSPGMIRMVSEQISELFKGIYPEEFVHYLLTGTNYPLIFAEISKEKTEEHYIFWKENLKEFIEWRDKNCRITPNGNYQQKYKHESKTPQELYRHWIDEIKDK